MEAVRAFNNELSSLYESKPPVSRAKMAHVTKCAIKAIKFYKHVVQSIEKFIQKCKPEYKVPGLYVIDSVVRQSRHQFGSNKDVFAARFTKNIVNTFQNLFKCPPDEKSKVVRVLNLWQKNEVFPSEVIQPLLDLAADPNSPSNIASAQAAIDRIIAVTAKPGSSQAQQPPVEQDTHDSESQAATENMLATQNDMLNTVTQLLQQTDSGPTSLSAQQQQLQQLQLLQQQLIQQTQLMQQPNMGPGGPIIDSNLLAQIQTLTNQLLSKTEAKPEPGGFNTKLLDFDYGESDEEEEKRGGGGQDNSVQGNVQTILNDPSLMQQIHQMSQKLQTPEPAKPEIDMQEQMRHQQLLQQQAEFDQQISQAQQPPQPPQPPQPAHFMGTQHIQQQEIEMDTSYQEQAQAYQDEGPNDEDFREHHEIRDRDERDDRDRRDRRSSRRSRDKSRSRTPKRRRRSRSRSRDRRRRSRSRDRHRRSRSRDKEREKQREKERERRKKGLPSMRDEHVTICTTTVWLGHLNKFTTEDELRGELEKYGKVESINMIPPRGCAYIVMQKRKDAYKVVDRLKGSKLNGSSLKTAWAQGTAMRESNFKDTWDVDAGAMYIPWNKLPPDMSAFLEGSIIDADTLPENLKDIPTEKVFPEGEEGQEGSEGHTPQQQTQQMPMMMGGPQPMMGGPMPGMMPGQVPPQMPPGMVPPQMMMQRPMIPGMPGMPPHSMAVGPGGPPQIIPGGPRPPMPAAMPGVRPGIGAPVPGMPLTVASTAVLSNPQTMPLINPPPGGGLVNSPAAPRPGFAPGGQRLGFNPNMPPPGFRLPFGSPQRPMMPGMPIPGGPIPAGPGGPVPPGPGGPIPPGPTPPVPEMKIGEGAPEMGGKPVSWPPDSNEKDEDDDEEEPGEGSEPRETDHPPAFPPEFPAKPLSNEGEEEQQEEIKEQGPGEPGPGSGPGPMMMPGPRGPFPGGLPGGPMDMRPRMGGPMMMPPNMGDRMMGPGGPNMGPMGGPMGPMMGPPPPGFFGPGGPRPGMLPPGFPPFPPRFPGGPGPMGQRPMMPKSLLDMDIKPTEDFNAEVFEGDSEFNAADEEYNEENDENWKQNWQEEEEKDMSNVYPFNTWKSTGNRAHEEEEEKKEEERFGNRNRNWRDNRNDSNRNDDDYDRRDRRYGKDRDRNRDDRNRDRDLGDRRRDRDDRKGGGYDRRDRDRDRSWEGDRDSDRGRSGSRRDRNRASRWSDANEVTNTENMKVENMNVENANVQNTNIEDSNIENINGNQGEVHEGGVNSVIETENEPVPTGESVQLNEKNESDSVNASDHKDTGSVGNDNKENEINNSNNLAIETTQTNGQEQVENSIEEPSKIDTLKQNEIPQENTGEDMEQANNESSELEEGEIES